MASSTGLSEATLRQRLPVQVRERVRLAKGGQVKTGCVVYWMRSALRGHDNPALDAAISVANSLALPMMVLLQIEDRYPHATARRQLFLLQGARDAQIELANRGVRVAVQIDRQGCRPAVLSTLAKEASLLIAEEPFAVPWLAGVENLKNSDYECPLWLVDCSSVVPSILVPKQSCHRAYVFENTTRKLHEACLAHPWDDIRLEDPQIPPCVDVESLNLAESDLESLVADMDVDHTVKPVEHTVGGSLHGYRRWSAWIASGGLKNYAKRRNESLDVHAVSRMSAYLNAGMVSPLRLAREASSAKASGKAKFLNEFLTWRGLSYAWCYHFPMPSSGCTLDQLPSWASQTLRAHRSDPRMKIHSRDTLARACSGDPAWDGMQRYLVETGELHNNARMGWGGAIPRWTASPEDALCMLIDLNNTFALDGHAPPSYGGLLGCLGLFSGPKGDTPIFGKVSARAPKAKYASLPSQISVLMSGLLLQNSSQQHHTPTKVDTVAVQTSQTSLSTMWKKRQDADLVKAPLPESETSAAEVHIDVSSKKRRWANLAPSTGQIVRIDID